MDTNAVRRGTVINSNSRCAPAKIVFAFASNDSWRWYYCEQWGLSIAWKIQANEGMFLLLYCNAPLIALAFELLTSFTFYLVCRLREYVIQIVLPRVPCMFSCFSMHHGVSFFVSFIIFVSVIISCWLCVFCRLSRWNLFWSGRISLQYVTLQKWKMLSLKKPVNRSNCLIYLNPSRAELAFWSLMWIEVYTVHRHSASSMCGSGCVNTNICTCLDMNTCMHHMDVTANMLSASSMPCVASIHREEEVINMHNCYANSPWICMRFILQPKHGDRIYESKYFFNALMCASG